jgi:hypothetical protein
MSGTATACHKHIRQESSQEVIFYEAHPTPTPDEIKGQLKKTTQKTGRTKGKNHRKLHQAPHIKICIFHELVELWLIHASKKARLRRSSARDICDGSKNLMPLQAW